MHQVDVQVHQVRWIEHRACWHFCKWSLRQKCRHVDAPSQLFCTAMPLLRSQLPGLSVILAAGGARRRARPEADQIPLVSLSQPGTV
jgi:hypothetical protein